MCSLTRSIKGRVNYLSRVCQINKMWGKLTVRPVSANLTKDISHADYLDPYVTLQLGDQFYQTRVALNQGGTPSWNDQVVFMVSKDDRLRVKVMDRSTAKDEFLGKVNIRISQLIHQPHLEESFDLRSRFLGRFMGRILLSFDWVPNEGFSHSQILQQGMGMAGQSGQQQFSQQRQTQQQFTDQRVPQQQFTDQRVRQQQFTDQRVPQQQFTDQRVPQQQFTDQRFSQQQFAEQQRPSQQFVDQRASQQALGEQRFSQPLTSEQRAPQQYQYQYVEQQRTPLEQRAYLSYSPYQRQYAQPLSQSHYVTQPYTDLYSSQQIQQPIYSSTRSSENLFYTSQPRYVTETISPTQYQTSLSTASAPLSNMTYRQSDYISTSPPYGTTYVTRPSEYSMGRVYGQERLESPVTRSGLHGPVTTVVRNEPYQTTDQYSFGQTRPLQQQYFQNTQAPFTDYQNQNRGPLGQGEQPQSNPLKEMVVIKQEEIIMEEINKTHPESTKPTLYDQQAQVSASQNIPSQNRQNLATGTTATQSNRNFENKSG